jgi:hypothetical protein
MSTVRGRPDRLRANGGDNPGKRKMAARYSGVCAKCQEGFHVGDLIVVTYEHDRCPREGGGEVPAVLRGVTRNGD